MVKMEQKELDNTAYKTYIQKDKEQNDNNTGNIDEL